MGDFLKHFCIPLRKGQLFLGLNSLIFDPTINLLIDEYARLEQTSHVFRI